MNHQREREVRVECDRRQGAGLLQEWGNGKERTVTRDYSNMEILYSD